MKKIGIKRIPCPRLPTYYTLLIVLRVVLELMNNNKVKGTFYNQDLLKVRAPDDAWYCIKERLETKQK